MNWDYNNAYKRIWYEGNLELLDILKKYYPIGEMFKYKHPWYENKINVLIEEYRIINGFYKIKVSRDISEGKMYYSLDPGKLMPTIRYLNLISLDI